MVPARASPFLLLLLVVGWANPMSAQSTELGPPPSAYLCWSLPDALHDLQERGLPVVFSSNVVRQDMQITSVPESASGRDLLAQLLAPHGLVAVAGGGGRLPAVGAGLSLGLLSHAPSSVCRSCSRGPGGRGVEAARKQDDGLFGVAAHGRFLSTSRCRQATWSARSLSAGM